MSLRLHQGCTTDGYNGFGFVEIPGVPDGQPRHELGEFQVHLLAGVRSSHVGPRFGRGVRGTLHVLCCARLHHLASGCTPRGPVHAGRLSGKIPSELSLFLVCVRRGCVCLVPDGGIGGKKNWAG